MNTPHVVVVGGGFAGIEVIRRLRKQHANVTITLISKTDTFEYYPGLYKLVTGALPIEVSVPLKRIFPIGVTILQGTYKELSQAEKNITLEDGSVISYDYLVLALGSETNYFNIPGLQERSFSFKSVKEALRLKRHFCELIGSASTRTKEEMVANLRVVIVGGGPSGVELAGDLKSYLTRLAREYKVDESFITIDLIEASPRVLPTLSSKVSRIAEARLRQMGVNIFTNRALQSEELESITLQDMQLKTATVIWTAGTRINPGFSTIPAALFDARKRVAVSPSLTLTSRNDVFIAGDGASTPYSGLAQTAIHNGAYIGNTIHALTKHRPARQYTPKRPSFVIPIGTGWSLFVHGNTVLTGSIPWLLRSLIDIRYFMSILPLSYVVRMLRKGKAYRKVHGGCSLDALPTV